MCLFIQTNVFDLLSNRYMGSNSHHVIMNFYLKHRSNLSSVVLKLTVVSLLLYTVAILLKDDYFVSGAGLPGRFKAEKVEFHWGHSNGSAGSEHSINGRRFPVEVRET